MEVATDPRVPGLRYLGTSRDILGLACGGSHRSELSWDNPGISWDKLVGVATDPRVPGLSCPGIIPEHPWIIPGHPEISL